MIGVPKTKMCRASPGAARQAVYRPKRGGVMSRMRAVAVAVAFALSTGVAVLPVSAQTGSQTEPVLFQIISAPGEALYYDFALSIRLSMEIFGTPIAVLDVEQMGREAVRTLNVEPNGSMMVEAAFEDFSQTAGSHTQDVLFSPVTFTMRPNGKIVDIDMTFPDAQLIKDIGFVMPDRPLVAGDSWTTPFESDEQGMHIRGTSTITLAEVESTSSGRVGHFRTRSEGTVTGGNFAKLPPGVQARFTATAHGTGETDWSVDRGRLLGDTEETTVEGTLEMTSEGMTIHGTMTGTISVQVQALESITVPAVPPDKLITAGKGIGAYTIGQSVAEVTSELGSPTIIPGGGKRPAMLAWTTGLQGYVDAIDPKNLLSLQIGDDPRFRTDKGIGFGSTRGAVLLAYGLTPTRGEVSRPDGARVNVLIYNDQGIAFALASTGPLFVIGGGRAPANTVVGVTVFPPGGAAELFPPP